MSISKDSPSQQKPVKQSETAQSVESVSKTEIITKQNNKNKFEIKYQLLIYLFFMGLGIVIGYLINEYT